MSTLQPYHVHNLILILRRANNHYLRVAASIRASFVPTHHARRHAQSIGLTVNIRKAVACDHRHVSVIPLPIVDQLHSPPKELNAQLPFRTRPVLNCTIPGQPVAVLTKTSPNGTTSAISPDDPPSSISLATPTTNPVGLSIDQWFVRDNHIDPPLEVENITVQDWLPLDVPIEVEASDWALELDSDSKDEEMYEANYSGDSEAWEMPSISERSPGSSALGSASYNSNSTVSSAGPITPPTTQDAQDTCPLMNRLKRKSAEISENEDFIKRPRFVRGYSGEWAGSGLQPRNIIRIPARK